MLTRGLKAPPPRTRRHLLFHSCAHAFTATEGPSPSLTHAHCRRHGNSRASALLHPEGGRGFVLIGRLIALRLPTGDELLGMDGGRYLKLDDFKDQDDDFLSPKKTLRDFEGGVGTTYVRARRGADCQQLCSNHFLSNRPYSPAIPRIPCVSPETVMLDQVGLNS